MIQETTLQHLNSPKSSNRQLRTSLLGKPRSLQNETISTPHINNTSLSQHIGLVELKRSLEFALKDS